MSPLAPPALTRDVGQVISDVDGALVTPDKLLTPAAIEAVRRLDGVGISFTLISSRPPRGMAGEVVALDVHLPFAAFNGGALMTPALAPIERHRLAPEVARGLLSLLDARGVDAWVFAGDDWLLRDAQGPNVPRERRAVGFDPVTTLGEALARRLGWPFKEGDDLHPPGNVARMTAGVALTDADRAPWLAAVAQWIDGWRRTGTSGLITCSALKRAYREILSQGRPEVRFVYLRGEPGLLAERVARRRGHFMPPSLLASQLGDLEPPAPDEPAITIDIDPPISAQVGRILQAMPCAPPRPART